MSTRDAQFPRELGLYNCIAIPPTPLFFFKLKATKLENRSRTSNKNDREQHARAGHVFKGVAKHENRETVCSVSLLLRELFATVHRRKEGEQNYFAFTQKKKDNRNSCWPVAKNNFFSSSFSDPHFPPTLIINIWKKKKNKRNRPSQTGNTRASIIRITTLCKKDLKKTGAIRPRPQKNKKESVKNTASERKKQTKLTLTLH